MKYLLNECRIFLIIAVLVYTIASCSSSRYSGGFSYHSNAKAPDIRSGNEAVPAAREQASVKAGQTDQDVSATEIEAINSMTDKITRKLTSDEMERMRKITEAFKEESHFQQENGTPISNRELVRMVSEKLVTNGTIDQLSARDMKKLDRQAQKMDKKLKKEGKDIDVKNNTNLELFFLIMGIAGLVLGILGVWVGWLLFLVFGGLYLYYKLVK